MNYESKLKKVQDHFNFKLIEDFYMRALLMDMKYSLHMSQTHKSTFQKMSSTTIAT
jgi:hypothetical protein